MTTDLIEIRLYDDLNCKIIECRALSLKIGVWLCDMWRCNGQVVVVYYLHLWQDIWCQLFNYRLIRSNVSNWYWCYRSWYCICYFCWTFGDYFDGKGLSYKAWLGASWAKIVLDSDWVRRNIFTVFDIFPKQSILKFIFIHASALTFDTAKHVFRQLASRSNKVTWRKCVGAFSGI